MASSSPPPLSSSPQDFLFSSSPLSDRSTWSDSSATTASIGRDVQIDTSATDDHFTRRLRDLLLLVVHQRESERDKHTGHDVQVEGDDQEGTSSSPASCSPSTNSEGLDETITRDQGHTRDCAFSDDETNYLPAVLNTPDGSPDLHMDDGFSPITNTQVRSSSKRKAGIDTETDLSTLVFASPMSDITFPIRTANPRPTTQPGYSYRIIHRATSYRAARQGFRAEPNTSMDAEMGVQPPPRKRPKILTRTSTHTRIRTELARAPASMRRAASLRSLPDDTEEKDSRKGEGSEKENVRPHARAGDIPTAPATPDQQHLNANANKTHARSALSRMKAGLGRVPIIAPPVPLPPPPTDTPVRVRIGRLLEREAELRAGMGLGHAGTSMRDGKADWGWEHSLGEELRGLVVRWFMEVQPPVLIGQGCSSDCRSRLHSRSITPESEDGDLGSESSTRTQTCSSDSSSSHSCSCSLSTTTNTTTTTSSSSTTRNTVTSMSPRIRLYPSSSSSSSTFSRYSSSTHKSYSSNLLDQLSMSPETRFHAVYLFLRFFHAVSGPGSGSGRGLVFGSELDEEGRVLVTWDVAVACLALSVKYHRDFLHPLLPVYALEFQGLAPHGELSYDDLEIAHRDVLCALGYRLGDTPQALLSELWDALPALRCLLSSTDLPENQDPDWNCVQRETWRVLFAAVLEPDVLRFSLSLLTTAALLHGVCKVLVRQYEDAAPWYLYDLCSAVGIGAGKAGAREMWGTAETAVGAVKRELEVLLDISGETMNECCQWLKRVRCSRR